jgi:hypothetical protein
MPLPKVKDPMILELKAICETKLAMPVTFIEANLSEANFGLDDLSDAQFPVLVYVTNKGSENEFNEANEIQRKAKLYCLLLNRVDGTTKDYASAEINSLLYQMYQLGQNLQYWINKSSLSVDGGVDKWKSDNLYEQFDAHLFGQGLDFEWRVNTSTNGYYNNAY